MTEADPPAELRLLSWNVQRSSIARFRRQLEALQGRSPDIVALQEVGVKASRRARELLQQEGFGYAAHSHEFLVESEPGSSGVAFASRWPFRVLDPQAFDLPYAQRVLSGEFYTPFGRVEGHTVHIVPGSSQGLDKVRMFEGLYDQLAVEDPPDLRFLCGDFNSPKEERPDGETIVFGDDERWRSAERSVLVDLADYDLPDAYREVNGYGDGAYSHVLENRGDEWRRRFDHVFASDLLDATEASYLHQYDDLSDHSPLEVVFTPDTAVRDVAGPAGPELRDPDDDSSSDASDVEPTVRRSLDGLSFEGDDRQVDPGGYRLGAFKRGWSDAVGGEDYGSLDTLTWQNLGWRLGQLFGETSEELQEELFVWCVAQQDGQ